MWAYRTPGGLRSLVNLSALHHEIDLLPVAHAQIEQAAFLGPVFSAISHKILGLNALFVETVLGRK